MRILITGGAGYIGTELAAKLVEQPDVEKIIVYDNLSRPNFNFFIGHKPTSASKIQYINGELLDSRKLRKVLKDIDVVYHLAAKVTTPFANNDGHIYEQVNHWGTAELVYAIEDSKVKRLVYLSSTSVYGSKSDFADENTEPNPKTFYGISKLRGEEHVRRLGNKPETFIIRCGNVYGYNRSLRFDAVINRFMFDANFSGRLSIHGNGKQKRAFIHVHHVGHVLSELRSNPLPSGTYNLVDKNLQVLDLVDVMKEMYPQIEFIFINQHMGLSELSVKPSELLQQHIPFLSRPIAEELEEFKNKLSF